MTISSTALEGMTRAQEKAERAARRLAQLSNFEDQAPVDNVDLSAEAVSLMEAENANAVCVKLAQTADEMEKKTLDLLA